MLLFIIGRLRDGLLSSRPEDCPYTHHTTFNFARPQKWKTRVAIAVSGDVAEADPGYVGTDLYRATLPVSLTTMPLGLGELGWVPL
jgi:hypothetical protein